LIPRSAGRWLRLAFEFQLFVLIDIFEKRWRRHCCLAATHAGDRTRRTLRVWDEFPPCRYTRFLIAVNSFAASYAEQCIARGSYKLSRNLFRGK